VSRSVRDTAGVLDAVHGAAVGDTVRAPAPARPYRDELGAAPGTLRIGLLTHNPLDSGEIHPDCVAAARDAAQLLESLGHIVEAAFPAAISNPEIVNHFSALWGATLVYNLRYWERKIGREITPDDVEPLTWTLAELGKGVSAPDYVDAQHAILDVTREVEQWFASGFDLLLNPTLGEPPLPLGLLHTPDEPFNGFIRAAAFVPYTPLANLVGGPAISLPLSWNDDDLPIGVQLQAAYGREDLLLRVAAQLAAARPWADRIPPVHV
jgi:amidase